MTMSRKGIKDKNRLKGIKLDKLQELIDSGRLYRYVEFCPIIGIERLQGDSKIKQLTELNAICEYEKENTKFKFIRMRSEDEIVLYNERSKYTPIIEYLLTEYLLDKVEKGECENGIYFLTTPQSLLKLGMVNENFLLIHSNSRKWDYRRAALTYHRSDFSMKDINYFLSATYANILKPIIRDSFKSIDNKRGIMIQRGFTLYMDNDGIRTYRNVLTTSREGQLIANITGRALGQLGISSTDKLYQKPNAVVNKFHRICDTLCKEELGYDGFYDCYALSINEERLEQIYNWNYYAAQKALNERVIERISTTKQLDTLTGKSRTNLINAVIDLNTNYNFQSDYELLTDKRERRTSWKKDIIT